jgi:hypothetical protein
MRKESACPRNVFFAEFAGKGREGGAVAHVRMLVMNIHTILKCQGDRWIFLPMLAVDGVVTMSDEFLGEFKLWVWVYTVLFSAVLRRYF